MEWLTGKRGNHVAQACCQKHFIPNFGKALCIGPMVNPTTESAVLVSAGLTCAGGNMGRMQVKKQEQLLTAVTARICNLNVPAGKKIMGANNPVHYYTVPALAGVVLWARKSLQS